MCVMCRCMFYRDRSCRHCRVNCNTSYVDLIRTRGNKYKLVQHHCHYDLRKFNFTNRVVPIRNSLSNHVVAADTVNTFKHCLDKFLSNQEVIYNYKVDLAGTGNSSIIN